MNMALVFGCLSLVLLTALDWTDLKSLRIKRCLAAWLAGLLAGAFAIYQAMAGLGYIHISDDINWLKYNIQRVRENKDKLPANIVMIEGGSYAARAVNYKLLEKILSSRGYGVMALQFSKPGATHIERMYRLSQFAKFIGPDAIKRMNKKNVVFLREVHRDYDLYPIMQFTRNYYTNSVLAYLRPENAWLALRAAWQVRGKTTDTVITPEAMLELVKHGLVNAFNIGAFHRFVPMADVRPADPLFDMDKKNPAFNYHGPSLNALLAAGRDEPHALGWKALVDDQINALGLKFKTAYYAVPSLQAAHMAYCKNVTDRTPYLTFAGAHDFLSRFDNPQSWYDDGHMMRRGSELYTAWLADQIIATGLLTHQGRHPGELLAVQARKNNNDPRPARETSQQ